MKRRPRYQVSRFTFKCRLYAASKSALRDCRFALLKTVQQFVPFFRVKGGL